MDDVLVAEVVFNLPLERPYTYAIPDELRQLIQAGQRVRAPLGRGNRSVVGYCVAVKAADSAQRKLKPITELLDRDPLLDPGMLELTRWIGERYLCGWGQVLDGVIPACVRRKSGTREVQSFVISPDVNEKLSSTRLSRQQKAVIEVLQT